MKYSLIKYLHSPWSGIVFFEIGLGLVINVIFKLKTITKNVLKDQYNWYTKRGDKMESFAIYHFSSYPWTQVSILLVKNLILFSKQNFD